MQHGKDNFQRALAGLFLNINRDSAPVVRNPDNISLFDDHFDMGAISGKRFVDGVIHNFIDQMMQAGGGSRSDIHTGPFSYRFQAFQHLNLRCIVFFCHFLGQFIDFRHFVLRSSSIWFMRFDKVLDVLCER